MDNDVAIFLDLDNVVIGALEVNLTFDVNLLLEKVRELTEGRIVLRRAYGDWRQRANMTKELANAGFELQSTVRLGSSSKNLADMLMVVEALSTMLDGRSYGTYVLVSGDRDFAPLVQELRKRGKRVVGVGVAHATSQRLASLCDHYIYYDEIANEAGELLDERFREYLRRAMDQLLQDRSSVAASLLKQRLQSLSKGAFGRSPLGKRNFRKLLGHYPEIVRLQQNGTTLYVARPVGDEVATDAVATNAVAVIEPGLSPRQLPPAKVEALLKSALVNLLPEGGHVRASLLKQQMQELSDGSFDETFQGDRSFRKFLDRYRELVVIEQEGSTLYARRADLSGAPLPAVADRKLSPEQEERLLQAALDDLLAEQERARASLLKQRMQELTNGAFDEVHQGDANFRQFLERYPNSVGLQQKGTTLLVQRPDISGEPAELHARYRSALKKRGLRVVPAEIRLLILKDVVALLQRHAQVPWRQLVDHLFSHYESNGNSAISKSYVNDVLRLARRADVLGMQNGGRLATSPVYLQIDGQRAFQDAVIRCDAAYLREIQGLDEPFGLEQASIALYESEGHARYLKVILNRFSDNGQKQ
jgi:uncharacterized LabA/DUF88 family protein